jgi:1-acyl-sn-glycerol-3-phosphate acyltransferase
MSRFPLAGSLLRRIGSEFVERTDRKVGARDTRRLLRSAASGQAMAFFPEGTFTHEVGLLRFHIGAFAAAARAHLPVVPAVIRGTRHTLPADSFWPNPGPIEVEILTVLPAIPSGDAPQDGEAAVKLRNAARAEILKALGEPDLATDKA